MDKNDKEHQNRYMLLSQLDVCLGSKDGRQKGINGVQSA